MEMQEVHEHMEHAHEKGQRAIGLTTAIVAVLLAIATMLGHRTHTEEEILQTRASDQWAFYQAKKIRSHIYIASAKLASLQGESGKEVAMELGKKGDEYNKEAEYQGAEARSLEAEQRVAGRRASRFDVSELFLEISIVLCSIALLTEAGLFWRISFISTAAGMALILWGFLLGK